MNRKFAQNAVAVVIGLALAVAVFFALSSRSKEQNEAELRAQARQISLDFSRSTELASEAVSVTAPGLTEPDGRELFAGLSARLFAPRLEMKLGRLEFSGIAAHGPDGGLLFAQGRPAPRNAAGVVADLDAPSAREFQARLAADGALLRWLAQKAAPGKPAVARTPGAETRAPKIWLVWREAEATVAALAALRVDSAALNPSSDMATVKASVRFHPTRSAEVSAAVGWTISDFFGGVSQVRSTAPFGDGWIDARVETISAGMFGRRPHESIASLVSGLALGLALYVLMRSERLRAARLTVQNQRVLRKIAVKQKELERAKERFEHLTESTNVIPWSADLDAQVFTYIGPQITDLTGHPVSAWRSSGFWAHHIHPDDRAAAVEKLRNAERGQYITLEYRLRAATGRIIHVRNMLSVTLGRTRDGRKRSMAQGFLLDVTEMKMAAAALEDAKQRAEEANRIKSEFLANMSHELRTPLNVVIGFSEIMKDELFGKLPGQYKEYAESVHASGKHLLQLINDVLDLSKIEAGRVELALEEIDLAELLAECDTLLHERISSAGLHCKLVIPPDLPLAMVDGRRIKQILLNLMANAVKFTPPGGSITLRAQHAPGEGVCISVRDTGVGMAPDEIPRALSKFGQIDGELARKHEGTGLGLPIAKSLVEMHGGDLEIVSEKGRGTDVRIWLPEERLLTAQAA